MDVVVCQVIPIIFNSHLWCVFVLHTLIPNVALYVARNQGKGCAFVNCLH